VSHHARIAHANIHLALDYLETARDAAEQAGGPGPLSLEIDRIHLEVKRAVYDLTVGSWTSAEAALQSALGPVSHLAQAQARGKRQRAKMGFLERQAGVILEQLVSARKAIRAALLNLRLRKGRAGSGG